MASTEIVSAKHVLQINPIPPRRRIKASELPLNATQRSSIDSLLHTIKKKGAFDALRKKVWSQYVDSDAKTTFATSLIDLAESEIDRDPILLSKERNKAANLIEGAVDRSSLYRNVEASVDSLIAEHINNVESAAREIRRLEVDEDVAAEEERLGSKTDDEYAKECALRREAREKTRKQEESRRRREEEKVRLRAEEKKKMLELEKLRGAEKRRKGEELKEEKRKKEREARQEAEKKLEEERETERRERYEWRKREERERVCEREREREISRDLDLVRSRQRDFDKTPREGEENYRRSRSRPQENSSPPGAIPAVDEKALEQAALELLLKEGRELAAKSGQKLEIERSDSLEPPPRRSHVSKPKVSESTTPKLKDKSTSPPSYDPRSTKASVSGSNIPSGPREYGNVSVARRREDGSRSNSHERSTKHRDFIRHHNHGRPRSRSRSRSRSRDRYSSRWDEERRKADAEAKEAWKRKAVRQREKEAEEWKRASKESRESRDKHRGRSRSQSQSRSRSQSRSQSRSRSRSVTRTRDAGLEKETNHRFHRAFDSHHRSSHRRQYSRSRSPASKSKYERSRSARPRKTHRDAPSSSRPKSPVVIDRYIPGGEKRARSRDRTELRRHDNHRDEGHREGNREGNREGHREEKWYVEIDRYVPRGGGSRERRKSERSRSRKR